MPQPVVIMRPIQPDMKIREAIDLIRKIFIKQLHPIGHIGEWGIDMHHERSRADPNSGRAQSAAQFTG